MHGGWKYVQATVKHETLYIYCIYDVLCGEICCQARGGGEKGVEGGIMGQGGRRRGG